MHRLLARQGFILLIVFICIYVPLSFPSSFSLIYVTAMLALNPFNFSVYGFVRFLSITSSPSSREDRLLACTSLLHQMNRFENVGLVSVHNVPITNHLIHNEVRLF